MNSLRRHCLAGGGLPRSQRVREHILACIAATSPWPSAPTSNTGALRSTQDSLAENRLTNSSVETLLGYTNVDGMPVWSVLKDMLANNFRNTDTPQPA